MMHPADDRAEGCRRAVRSRPPHPPRGTEPYTTADRGAIDRDHRRAQLAGHRTLVRISDDYIEPEEVRAEVCGGGGRSEQQQAHARRRRQSAQGEAEARLQEGPVAPEREKEAH